jgi:signal transduction histidine kinase
VIHDGPNRIAGHFGIQRDVTDRHLAAEQLAASREELRALAARLQQVREEERTVIAREIHDELGQALTGLRLDMAWMTRGLAADHKLSGQCASIIARIDGTLNSVRRIATELRPSVLDHLGLSAAVEWQVQEFGARTGIAIELDLCDDCLTPPNDALPNDLGSSVFRILQESLTNVARHAHASHVAVTLDRTNTQIMLDVSDDGVGVPAGRLDGTASLGLVGMRERALACGGALSITSQPGGGTTVQLVVPVAGIES